METKFKDSTRLTKWTVWLLYAYILINIASIIGNIMEYRTLSQLRIECSVSPEMIDICGSNNPSTNNAIFSEIVDDMTEIQTFLIKPLLFLINQVSFILILIWIYRANYNAHQLGAQSMRFSPRWSVGWYFIPIANLWKPYQVMKEIWKTSKNPADWQNQHPPRLLSWWWSFWIMSFIYSLITLVLVLKVKHLNDFLLINIAAIVSSAFIVIPGYLTFLVIVRQVYTMQRANYVKTVNGA